MDIKRVVGRTGNIGLAALACGFASAFASLLTLNMSLPPTDLAYGQTIWESWASPVEGTTARIFAILGAIIAFPFARGLLWKTNLWATIPITVIATVLTAALFGPLGPIAAFMALLIGITTMAVCNTLDIGNGSVSKHHPGSRQLS